MRWARYGQFNSSQTPFATSNYFRSSLGNMLQFESCCHWALFTWAKSRWRIIRQRFPTISKVPSKVQWGSEFIAGTQHFIVSTDLSKYCLFLDISLNSPRFTPFGFYRPFTCWGGHWQGRDFSPELANVNWVQVEVLFHLPSAQIGGKYEWGRVFNPHFDDGNDLRSAHFPLKGCSPWGNDSKGGRNCVTPTLNAPLWHEVWVFYWLCGQILNLPLFRFKCFAAVFHSCLYLIFYAFVTNLFLLRTNNNLYPILHPEQIN